MLLQTIIIFTFNFIWTISALECLQCNQTFDLKLPERIDITKCRSVDASYSSCSQLLEIGYPKDTASILFTASSSESLVLSNAVQMMTNTTMIWLDRYQFIRTFQIFCFNTNACKPDIIGDIYADARCFEDFELSAQLVSRLYDAPANPKDRVCADNQDKPVLCPYGFCQLTSRDSASFSRSCVPNGSIANPYGVILQSKTISETDIESSVMYTCNKPMCNNSTMAKEVRQLLEIRNLLKYSITTTTTTTSTTTASIATTPKRSTGNTAKPLISIHCGLIFLITFVFQL